jgi:hypothetical protein
VLPEDTAKDPHQIQTTVNNPLFTRRDVPAAIGLTLLYLILSVWVFGSLEEDSFIFFRYIDQLFAGNGLVFNNGDKCEGFSSFLWILLLCPFKAAGVPLGLAARFMGMLFSLGTAFAAVLFLKKLIRGSYFLPWLTGCWCVTFMPFLFWGQAGLETALTAFELMAFVYSAAFVKKGHLWGGAFLVLGLMTRPELNGSIPLYLIWILFWKKRNKANLLAALLVAGTVAGFHLLRFLYYGDFVPNPVYVKVNGTFSEGLVCLKGFYSAKHIIWMIPFFLYALLRRAPSKLLVPAFIIVIGYTFFNLYVGGDRFRDHYRFFVPCIAPFMVISAYGLHIATNALYKKIGKYCCIPVVGILAVVFISGTAYTVIKQPASLPLTQSYLSRGLSKWTAKAQHQFDPYFFNFQYSYYPWLGVWIKQNFPPGTKIAYDQMGQTPFFAGIDYYFIDIFGLMSRPIAKYYKKRNPSSIKTFINQALASLSGNSDPGKESLLPVREHPEMNQKIVLAVLEQRPEIIMVCGFIATWHPWLDLWADPVFKKNYVLKQVFGNSRQSANRAFDYNVFNASIFFRRDIDPATLPQEKCTFPGVATSDLYHYTEPEEVRQWLTKYYPHLLPLTD